MQQTADYLQQVQKILERIVRDFRPELLAATGAVAEELKSDNSPVTVLDKKLEQLIRDGLTSFDASIPIVGEEFGGDIKASSTHWLIDPIDGTENFIRGLPFVRNMVTLIEHDEPVFAFVYKPITDELFLASKGKGATKNGQPLHVSQRPLSRAWVDLAVPLNEPDVFPLVAAVRDQIAGYRVLGEFTYLTEGRVDAQLVYKSGGGPWDYAPRALLMTEAGGRVANLGTETYDYRNSDMLLAGPIIFDELMAIISKHIGAST